MKDRYFQIFILKTVKTCNFSHGLYFALFPSLHICDLYFDITSGSRGSLKGKDIIIIRNYKQYTISKKKKIQIFCQTIFVLQSRYITIRTNHIYLRVQICSCFWFHWAIAPVNTNDMCKYIYIQRTCIRNWTPLIWGCVLYIEIFQNNICWSFW